MIPVPKARHRLTNVEKMTTKIRRAIGQASPNIAASAVAEAFAQIAREVENTDFEASGYWFRLAERVANYQA